MSARTSARDVECPTCGIGAGLPCRSLKTGRSNTDTHKARHEAAVRATLHPEPGSAGPLYGELCAGYGGIGMGAQAVLGGRLAWYAEWDDDPSRIMAHHHPGVENYRDVTAIDWHNVPRVDVLTAGFPCQPFSHAGKRLGANDERHLWPHIAHGISIMRPQLVLLENVRGLASGQGEPDTDEIVALDARRQHIDRALVVIERRRRKAIRENATRYIRQHTDDSHRLMVERRRVVARAKRARAELARALATVLGDLAHLGYDAQWYGLRAADVGAPHGRFRFFIYAWPADAPSDPRWIGYGDAGAAAAYRDGTGLPERGDAGGVRAASPGAPAAADGDRGASPDLTLLPTPAVNDMGAAYTPDEWDAWTARQKAKHGNGNGHGKSLEIEAQKLLPTPNASDTSKHAGQPLEKREGHALRIADVVEHGLPSAGRLLPTPTTVEGTGPGSHGTGGDNLRTVVDALLPTPRASDGEKGGPNQRGSSGDLMLPSAALLLPTPTAQDGNGSRNSTAYRANGRGNASIGDTLTDFAWKHEGYVDPRLLPTPQTMDAATGHFSATPASERRAGGHQVGLANIGSDSGQDWGEYGPAIRRWESIIGRPAPSPTEIGPKGQPRLSPAFVEWMMGLPAGHVTDPVIWDDGRSLASARNAELKALGNGVVPQQCAAATWAFVQDMLAERMTKAASA